MMPLYEGIALIQEKQPVVLDLGYDYTKFGFAGEAAPRCVIKTEFWCAGERRMKRVFDYKDEEELYENLVDMLHLLYFKYILVNPKERKVVVVESLLTPTLIRETLAKVLYIHYEVSGVVWADNARLSALTLGTSHTLVIDIGAREAEVTAVAHSSPIIKAIQTAPIGSRAIHAELVKMIREDNNDENLVLNDDILEDILIKTCFIGNRSRAVQWDASIDDASKAPTPAKSVQFPLPGRSPITVSGKTRELAANIMFARDNEMASLGDIILQCIMLCPIDTRRPLLENLLITGGCSNIPGLLPRLLEEIKWLLTLEPYSARLPLSGGRAHTSPVGGGRAAWLGGSLAAAAAAAHHTSRDQYRARRRLADWADLTNHDHDHGPQQNM